MQFALICCQVWVGRWTGSFYVAELIATNFMEWFDIGIDDRLLQFYSLKNSQIRRLKIKKLS